LKKAWIYLLIVVALVAGAAFVACGGDEDEDGGEATPVAEENGDVENGDAENGDAENGDAEDGEDENGDAENGDEENGDAEDGDGGGEGAIEDIPVYPGAKKIGDWSASTGGMAGAPMDLGEYSTVKYAMFETDDSADDVLDFYKDKMKGWDEQGTFSFGEAEEAMSWLYWTKDEGTVGAMVMVIEEEGATAFTIWVASE
jgi:hypothetical protein